jgi:hypothetical protein
MLNSAYQHLMMLKLMQVTPAEKMEFSIRSEIARAQST